MSKSRSYMMNQFTFGFELEGWANNMGAFREFQKFTKGYFKEGKYVSFAINRGDAFHGDGSINPSRSRSSSSRGSSCECCSGSGRIEDECSSCDGRGFFEDSCDECDGSGFNGTNPDGTRRPCSYCNGTGRRHETCDDCDGSGTRERDCPDCGGDGSYRGDNYQSFEWSSPVFHVVPKNVIDVINYLRKATGEYGINTNDSCGFHIHIGFPEKILLGPQMLWALIKLASDEGFEHFKNIQSFNKHNMYNERYATNRTITAIRDMRNKVRNEKEFMSLILSSCYTDNKYQMLRIHPQGTLEWRGPRSFLDRKDPKEIGDFFITRFVPFVRFLAESLASDIATFGDITLSKRELFDIIKQERRSSPVQSDREIVRPNRKNDNRFNWALQDVAMIGKIYHLFPWLKKAKFTNAVITLGSKNNLLWKAGTWEEGTWERGTFYNGRFNGIWKKGNFRGGAFRGIWEHGQFLGGTFEGGDFLGGKFSYPSKWADGNFRNGLFIGTPWQSGKFYGGRMESARWESGEFFGGIIKNSTWRSGIWHVEGRDDNTQFSLWTEANSKQKFCGIAPSKVFAMKPKEFRDYIISQRQSDVSDSDEDTWLMFTVDQDKIRDVAKELSSMTPEQIKEMCRAFGVIEQPKPVDATVDANDIPKDIVDMMRAIPFTRTAPEWGAYMVDAMVPPADASAVVRA